MTDHAKWNIRFMRMAYREVALWSKDPSAKVGCVLVSPTRRQIATGYNGLPRGVADTEARLHNEAEKNRLTVHAELNAIFNAQTDLTGWTLYATKSPCVDCAKAIIQVGITRVVSPTINADSKWAIDQVDARDLMREAGIGVYTILEEKYR